jgi:hypothetical protein
MVTVFEITPFIRMETGTAEPDDEPAGTSAST